MGKGFAVANLLESKVCLVTGAGRGIGEAIARCYATEGAVVYANERTAGSVAAWLKTCPKELQEAIHPICFDVSDEAAVLAGMKQVRQEQGRLDVLVNNAAVEYNELIGMMSSEHLQAMLAVNVCGPIYAIQGASRLMRRGGGGSIINIASLTGLYGNAGQMGYAATKGAVIALTKSAAKELAAQNIRVNAVAPGLTATAMMDQADPAKLQQRIDNIALGRLAQPEDIANACLYLASDLASYVSGQVLAVDGCTSM